MYKKNAVDFRITQPRSLFGCLHFDFEVGVTAKGRSLGTGYQLLFTITSNAFPQKSKVTILTQTNLDYSLLYCDISDQDVIVQEPRHQLCHPLISCLSPTYGKWHNQPRWTWQNPTPDIMLHQGSLVLIRYIKYVYKQRVHQRSHAPNDQPPSVHEVLARDVIKIHV